jgi:hypothetical protein
LARGRTQDLVTTRQHAESGRRPSLQQSPKKTNEIIGIDSGVATHSGGDTAVVRIPAVRDLETAFALERLLVALHPAVVPTGERG